MVGMDWKQLKELIDLVSEKGFAEFEVERQGFRLKITQKTGEHAAARTIELQQGPFVSSELSAASVQPVMHAATQAAGAPRTTTGDQAQVSELAAESLHIIKSPIVGTFYRSPSPTSEPFVKVGDRVEPDAVVCIIEAMKLMNEIQAETSGTIAEIYVENGQPVEYNQPLFGVRT
jgi:acetyl-CoA carboxylase biotin carboxyl carrier protein